MKISYKDFAYLMNYEMRHPFIKYCCNCYAIERDASVILTAKVKWLFYILLFIPVHILIFFYCLWDGGIKDFGRWERTMTSLHRFNMHDKKYKEWKKRSGM